MEPHDSHPSEDAPSSFPHFANLPLELQLKIYRLMAHESRTVKIDRIHRRTPRGAPKIPIYLACYDAVPAVLHTCHTSREEAMGVYAASFRTETSERYVWVNFGTDAIRLTDEALSMVDSRERAKIRNVIVDVSYIEENMAYFDDMFSPMESLLTLDFMSGVRLEKWESMLHDLERWFKKWFGDREGWVLPDMRIIEQATGRVMDKSNICTFGGRNFQP